MIGKYTAAASLALLFIAVGAAAADRPRGAVECAELKWSPAVLAANPDIARACQGVYEKDGILYAKATIQVVSVQGNKLKFRALLTDGTLGKRRSVTLDSGWRVRLGGREYRPSELVKGQQLNIYLPQDRFSLTVAGSNVVEASAIEEDED
jgi:hypothetical protein